ASLIPRGRIWSICQCRSLISAAIASRSSSVVCSYMQGDPAILAGGRQTATDSPFGDPTGYTVDGVDRQLHELRRGPAHRFAEFATAGALVPRSGAGIYTVWDDAGELIYVGIAGRNPNGSGLASRLRSHVSGRRSGDQFCVYVADHYVMPELTAQ